MAWCLPGDEPSPEAVMTQFTDVYICVYIYASSGFNELIHCGLVTPNGDIELGQHWLG